MFKSRVNLISQFICKIQPNCYFAHYNSHILELEIDRDDEQIHFSLRNIDASKKDETLYYKSDKNSDKNDSVKTFARNLKTCTVQLR